MSSFAPLLALQMCFLWLLHAVVSHPSTCDIFVKDTLVECGPVGEPSTGHVTVHVESDEFTRFVADFTFDWGDGGDVGGGGPDDDGADVTVLSENLFVNTDNNIQSSYVYQKTGSYTVTITANATSPEGPWGFGLCTAEFSGLLLVGETSCDFSPIALPTVATPAPAAAATQTPTARSLTSPLPTAALALEPTTAAAAASPEPTMAWKPNPDDLTLAPTLSASAAAWTEGTFLLAVCLSVVFCASIMIDC